ncbi:cbb3-type cytochrome oxidase assembly protein CcoS [Salmonirosea aquatica]|uniref:Cbb3-type cytochrome oxidase assembly protein CcoS n=1 Tax=Salmonirosea aquatica TaxID=2654236 RepID=A0A7C9F2E1_9BACT|nr:cbb3-type cytochrome oxidase assembly protein CcoS [Cytophagaceae bacterium SJW1-29]
MSALIILIGFSLLAALGFLGAFVWSVRGGQFDDDYTPSVRILFDDTINPLPSDKSTPQTASK